MKVRRVAIGILVGTLLSFLWVNLSWVKLGLHKNSIREFPNQSAVAEVLKEQKVERGIYVIPAMNSDYNDEEGMAAHMEENRVGPYMMGVVRSGSLEKAPTFGGFIAKGLIIQLIAVTIAALLLAAAASNLNFIGRYMFVLLLGAFAAVTGHLPNWHWWAFPVDHTVISILDSLISWGLAALAMAAIIKPTSTSSSGASSGEEATA